METRTEIKVFRVALGCTACKKGTMICINPAKVAEGQRRKHQCSNDSCQAIQWIEKKIYPQIEYEGATVMQQLSSAANTAKEKLKEVLGKKALTAPAPPPVKPKQKPKK